METLNIEVHKDDSEAFESCLRANNCKIADFNLGKDENHYLYEIITEDAMNYFRLSADFLEIRKSKS